MGLGSSIRCKTLWRIACLTLLWIVWQERNGRIFKDKWRTLEMLWDLLYFYSSSFKASFINNFKDIPLNILQLNQHSMCRPKGKSTMRGAQPKFEQMITLYILLWPIPFFPNVLAQRSSLCVDQFFVFLGRIPQPSHGLFIHSCFYSKKKKERKITYKSFLS